MMAWLKTIDQRMFKTVGVYVIIILALVRFMVYPIHGAVAEKRILFTDLYETYQLKRQHSERQGLEQARPAERRLDKEAVASRLYEKDMIFSSIQADVLENMTKMVEKKGLTVRNFELLEATTGKTISEVPVIIRISGKPGDLLGVLSAIATDKKALVVRNLEMNRSGQDILLSLTLTAFRMEK